MYYVRKYQGRTVKGNSLIFFECLDLYHQKSVLQNESYDLKFCPNIQISHRKWLSSSDWWRFVLIIAVWGAPLPGIIVVSRLVPIVNVAVGRGRARHGLGLHREYLLHKRREAARWILIACLAINYGCNITARSGRTADWLTDWLVSGYGAVVC